jgi:hypothetical protein
MVPFCPSSVRVFVSSTVPDMTKPLFLHFQF